MALTEPAAANNPTAFRNAVVDTLKTLQPGVLRFMDGGADFASTTANMIAVPFARLRAGYGEGQTEQDDISIGLHDFLLLCQAVGAEPWYTVPAGISPADMQNLIQYLGGDASTPYGAIRASLGQSAPWTSVFPTIHLELGSEMWNSAAFPGEAVAQSCSLWQRCGDRICGRACLLFLQCRQLRPGDGQLGGDSVVDRAGVIE